MKPNLELTRQVFVEEHCSFFLRLEIPFFQTLSAVGTTKGRTHFNEKVIFCNFVQPPPQKKKQFVSFTFKESENNLVVKPAEIVFFFSLLLIHVYTALKYYSLEIPVKFSDEF